MDKLSVLKRIRSDYEKQRDDIQEVLECIERLIEGCSPPCSLEEIQEQKIDFEIDSERLRLERVHFERSMLECLRKWDNKITDVRVDRFQGFDCGDEMYTIFVVRDTTKKYLIKKHEFFTSSRYGDNMMHYLKCRVFRE